MAVESIGTLVPTKIPGYADAADIQAALRAYHYGSYSFDTSESNAANLINPSIAYTINNLQSQITTLGDDYVDEDVLTAKGSLISATAASTPSELTVGTNNQFLIANSATSTGLQWTSTLASPTITSPIVTGLTLNDSSIIFEGATDNAFETTLTVTDPTADRTITLPNVSGTVVTTGDTGTVTNAMLATAPLSAATALASAYNASRETAFMLGGM